MNQTSDEVELAVEIIRQLENLDFSEQTILQAMVHVCRDTLNKLESEQQQTLREELLQALQQ
ncbi:hypothetical protein [Pelagibaculum spongiae]|uniref:Uncharacterized protein n=1 Tax=Pelagibaculum spongiae TaxID=2080658 RepID=A0A2V1H543_9GAMM|nr:hypothetical protein [Pelagibaculum spongiae]PVZ72358.1 hypothetical protein DC094_04950 [Pelagibaculum spongiae]